MHIYIISQYLNLAGQNEDRLYKLGREYVDWGHDLTFFTTAEGLDLSLGKKKIGLTQRECLNMVAFNVNYTRDMSRPSKMFSFLKFARMVTSSGRRMPQPDLIVVASPPLTALMPALSLGKHYQVPVIAEVRELWPDALIRRGTINNKLFTGLLRRMEEYLYKKLDHLIAGGQGIAETVKDYPALKDKVTVIPENLDLEQLIENYDQVISKVLKKIKDK